MGENGGGGSFVFDAGQNDTEDTLQHRDFFILLKIIHQLTEKLNTFLNDSIIIGFLTTTATPGTTSWDHSLFPLALQFLWWPIGGSTAPEARLLCWNQTGPQSKSLGSRAAAARHHHAYSCDHGGQL